MIWARMGMVVAVWLASGAVGSADVAVAQDTVTEDSSEKARDREARRLFEAGRLAFTSGRFESALQSFRRAHELSGRSLLLFNIGACYDRLRQDEQALETFRRYLTEVPDALNRPEVEARITVLERAVEPKDTPGEEDPAEEDPLAASLDPIAEPDESTPPPPAYDLSLEPTSDLEEDDDGSIFETWWFWTLTVAVVAGGVVAAVLLTTSEDSTENPLPGTTGGVSRALR